MQENIKNILNTNLAKSIIIIIISMILYHIIKNIKGECYVKQLQEKV